eukprot:TRINITY_DN19035_c0_g1_i1.p1 TRINITY_DN19035_c0_g1~~TRINITY_DN19035_c0_g1_i1.p1  ORF type:complete len:272 (+),score=83.64 TRINITY_DN19035_c0_g1_i1:42-818(+)
MEGEEKEKEFPERWNAFHRMRGHEVAEELGLIHRSKGEGAHRRLYVKKPKSALSLPTSQESKEDSKESKKEEEKEEEKEKARDVAQKVDLAVLPREEVVADDVESIKVDSAAKKPASKKRKKRKRKKKNNGTAAGGEGKKAGDDDAVFRMFDTSKCSYERCDASVVTFGRLCRLCKKKFCIQHALYEVHGCGAAAKKAAKANWRKERLDDNGKVRTEPVKTLSAAERQKLKKKLASSIQNKSGARGAARKRSRNRKKK